MGFLFCLKIISSHYKRNLPPTTRNHRIMSRLICPSDLYPFELHKA